MGYAESWGTQDVWGLRLWGSRVVGRPKVWGDPGCGASKPCGDPNYWGSQAVGTPQLWGDLSSGGPRDMRDTQASWGPGLWGHLSHGGTQTLGFRVPTHGTPEPWGHLSCRGTQGAARGSRGAGWEAQGRMGPGSRCPARPRTELPRGCAQAAVTPTLAESTAAAVQTAASRGVFAGSALPKTLARASGSKHRYLPHP